MAASAAHRRVALIGYAFVVGAALTVSLNAVFARLIIDTGFGPLDFSAARVYGAGILLLPFLLPVLGRVRRGHLLPLALFGVVGLVIGQVAQFAAVQDSDVALVFVIVAMAPVFITLYERARLGSTLPVHAYGAIVVAVAGVALAISGGTVGAITARGFVFALLALLAWSTTIVLIARLPSELPPLARTAGTFLAGAAAFCVIVPPWTLPFELLGASATFVGGLGFTLPLWAALAGAIVIGTALNFILWVAGSARVGAGATSVVGMTEPVFVAAASWLLLGQHLALLQVVGLIVAVVGVIVVEWARMGTRRLPVPDAPVEL